MPPKVLVDTNYLNNKMLATIITIGDEILIGQIVDTNSAWISSVLNDAGVRVLEKLSVADDSFAIRQAVDNSIRRCEVTIITGGLGPTKDDITKKTLADYFGCDLVRDDTTYAWLKEMTAQRGFRFNELNQAQAMVPECCTVLHNEYGTAPGMWFERGGHVVVSLPGVPFEMKGLMNEQVMPKLKSYFNLQAIVHKTANLFGISESELALLLAEWENALPEYLKLAYLPNLGNMRLRLSAYEVDGEQAMAEIDRRFAEAEKLTTKYWLGYGDLNVVSATAAMLKERGETLAVAESCTGGALSSAFTAMAGASAYFMGGVVSYDNSVKSGVLGVNKDDIERYGAVSKTVAEQMARGVRELCGTTYGVATTGVAGPDGGTDEKPAGTVWIAVSTAERVFARKFSFGANQRAQNIQRAVSHGVNLVRLAMLGYEDAELVQGTL